MKLKVKIMRQILAVEFPAGISADKLAKEMKVSKQTAWLWLKGGVVAEKYIDGLKALPLEKVKMKEAKCRSSLTSSSIPTTGSQAPK